MSASGQLDASKGLANLALRSSSIAGAWISTNAAGLRVGVGPDGSQFYIPSLAVASSTDPITHNVVTTRADGTLVLTRADGRGT